MKGSHRITVALAAATAAFVSAPSNLQAQVVAPEPTAGRRAPVNGFDPGPRTPRPDISIKGGFGRVDLPGRSFFGTENPGRRVPELGLFQPKERGDLTSLKGEISIPIANPLPFLDRIRPWGQEPLASETRLRLGVKGQWFDVDDRLGRFDPMGDAFLIPGPLGGPSGFALPSFGGLNVVEDMRYDADYRSFMGTVELARTCFYASGFSIGCYYGAGIGRLDFDERVSASIPGFNALARYQTDVDVDSFRLYKGIDIEQALTDYLSIFLHADAGVEFNRGRGRDSLAFDFFGGSQTSQNVLRERDVGFIASVMGGMDYEVTPNLAFYVSGAWERRTNLPVVVRDGTHPSFLDLRSGSSYEFRAGAKLTFGSPRAAYQEPF